MLAHFGHPAVFFSYLLAVIISYFLFWLPERAIAALTLGVSVILMDVDYLVHSAVHDWKRLKYPMATTIWLVVVSVVLAFGLIAQWWQLVVIFLAQGLWDNSWHAHHHHRKEGEPRAELDHPLVRWGVAIVAAASILI